jgi:hypothetical protein
MRKERLRDATPVPSLSDRPIAGVPFCKGCVITHSHHTSWSTALLAAGLSPAIVPNDRHVLLDNGKARRPGCDVARQTAALHGSFTFEMVTMLANSMTVRNA